MKITTCFLPIKTLITHPPDFRLHRAITILSLICFSIFLVALLNRGALAPQIIGMDTADGCATTFVRNLFLGTSPYDGFKKVNMDDVSCGRFRPLGHYYMAASYLLNALRCGIPFVLGCQIPMCELVNAELWGHTQFQVVFAGLVVSLASWLVLSQSGSWLATLSVLLFGSSALSLSGNLYKYFADGQEILLTFFSVAYLFCFLRGLSAIERGQSATWSFATGCFFAIMMTASKETIIAIAGVMLAFCVTDLGIQRWIGAGFNRRSRYLVGHIALLVSTQAWLLTNIPPASGRYTGSYHLSNAADLGARLHKMVLMLADNPGTGLYLTIVMSLCFICLITMWIHPRHMNNQTRNILRLALLSGGAGIGSVLIYLPWELVIRKYLYCAEIFLVICTGSLIGVLAGLLQMMGLNRILLAIIGVSLLLVPCWNVRTTLQTNDHFFADHYDSRRLLESACRELQHEVSLLLSGGTPSRVAVFDNLPPLGHDMIRGQEQLHLERFLNRACGLNLLSQGQFQFTRRSDYSNLVLQPIPYAPMIELYLLEKWTESDWSYVLVIDSTRETAIDLTNIRRSLERNKLYEAVSKVCFRPPLTEQFEGEIVMYRKRTNIPGVL